MEKRKNGGDREVSCAGGRHCPQENLVNDRSQVKLAKQWLLRVLSSGVETCRP